MSEEQKIDWTSGEIGNLWNIYMANSMAVCMFKHFLLNVDDAEIKDCLVTADQLSRDILTKLKELFQDEGMAVPLGFSLEMDVNADAPRFFSDSFYLNYLDMMAKYGALYYSVALPGFSKMDLRHSITDFHISSLNLSNKVTEMMLEKGLHVRAPSIPTMKEASFVEKQSFFNGYFGDKRPLSAMEITHLFLNIQVNAIKTILVMGFSQVAKNEDVRNYFLRGKKINIKQHNTLSQIMYKEDLPVSIPSQFMITESTEAPYSDKLMLFHISNLSSAKVRNFGDSMAVSPRHDLGATYARFLLETANFAEDGGNIQIENEWMERQPSNVDRNQLAKEKK
ncbi:DUF3231 family protein [Bacillus sp. ISL-55]|uniref:DUF3231 family protein n=1 Tax=Bacillus sp. ISL-55 TaxID=2819134 RepID=UPI001BEA8848|nr:DUF3231 family protein [Bacillus sp. ISL-55]MBT2693869.1 DUF3231 family protein [Bacillus sp. ISL-55]